LIPSTIITDVLTRKGISQTISLNNAPEVVGIWAEDYPYAEKKIGRRG